MRCLVPHCTAQVHITLSFRDGPTVHACRDHVALLPKTPAKVEAVQGALL